MIGVIPRRRLPDLSLIRLVTAKARDTQTDRQTDRPTDGWTDGNAVALSTATLAKTAARSKNYENSSTT